MKAHLDHMRSEWEMYMHIRSRRQALEEQEKELEAKFREEAGSAQEISIGGKVVATFKPTAKLREAELRNDNGELYQKYLTPEVVYKFDAEKFRNDHPQVYLMYQSRSWRIK